MADIGITKYRARVIKENALPSNPGNPATNPVDPVNPPASGGGTGVNQFIQLTDTPASYSGASLNYARVNAGETGLEFRTPAQVKSDLGVVESINAGAGIQVNPNPTASTPQVALTGQALSFHSLTGDGFVYRTSGTVGVRTLTAGAGITITNGDGIGGNPVISATGNIVEVVTFPVGINQTPTAGGNVSFSFTSIDRGSPVSTCYRINMHFRLVWQDITGTLTTLRIGGTSNISNIPLPFSPVSTSFPAYYKLEITITRVSDGWVTNILLTGSNSVSSVSSRNYILKSTTVTGSVLNNIAIDFGSVFTTNDSYLIGHIERQQLK